MTTIAGLNYADLRECNAWKWTGQCDDRGDEILAQVQFDSTGRIPADVGEVWCLSVCRFADGSEHAACAMCRGDSELGPTAISVWNGTSDIRLMVPPAPDFVLDKEGPTVFCRSFGLDLKSVFPIEVRVIPEFSTQPLLRSARIESSGRLSSGCDGCATDRK